MEKGIFLHTDPEKKSAINWQGVAEIKRFYNYLPAAIAAYGYYLSLESHHPGPETVNSAMRQMVSKKNETRSDLSTFYESIAQNGYIGVPIQILSNHMTEVEALRTYIDQVVDFANNTNLKEVSGLCRDSFEAFLIFTEEEYGLGVLSRDGSEQLI